MATASPAEQAHITLEAVIAERNELRASFELALDALQALVSGYVERSDKGTVLATYAKVIDDRAAMTENQQRSVRFAKGLLAEAGR